MKMECMCKDDFIINDVLIGRKGDLLEITDAIPENEEDVSGYCDIKNLTTGQITWSNWSEIEGYGALNDIVWTEG